MKAATKVREIEKADYDETHKDYSESIDALERAIAVLKKQAHDRKQASFTQVSALKELNLIPKEAKRAIDLFLAQDPDEGLAVSAPEANAYEFQSQGIIDMLEKLLDKFSDERTTLEKEETNSRHAFEMLIQDLTAQVDNATTSRDDDQKYLADLTATCEQKASDFESRQQLRADEIVAIEKAIEIISSGAVSGA